MIRAIAVSLALFTAPLRAETALDLAEEAKLQLSEAQEALAAAQTGNERIAALTETVDAFENGLTALRDGLRQASIREQAIANELDARSEEIGGLLSVLQTIGRSPAPILMLHPLGPTGTARSGMIISDVTPALQQEAQDLRAKLEEVAALRQLRSDAVAELEAGLAGAQDARTALADAISERTDLPKRFADDPVQTAVLVASSETLEAFANNLRQSTPETADLPAMEVPAGELALPVDGRVIRKFQTADAAGVVRPGILIATQPRALVSAPVTATIRYAGPLLSYGNVVIIEPETDILWIFAGLAEVFGTPGDIVPVGAILGFMGGEILSAQDILTETDGGQVPQSSETLYLEVRDGQSAVDPGQWFALD